MYFDEREKTMKPEEAIEGYLKRRGEELGFLVYKFVSPGNSGVPDRLLIGHGKTFFVETKAPGEKPRKLQARVIARINDHGGMAYVTASKEDVDTLLNIMLQDVIPEQKHPEKLVKNSCISKKRMKT
jgi:hypothetical protein